MSNAEHASAALRRPGPGERWLDTPWLALPTGLLAAAVNRMWIERPAPWRDEAATWISGERGVAQLVSMLGHIDAVHGGYYLAMKAWRLIAGSSPTDLRLASTLAIGLMAGLIFLLGRELFGARVGLWAGLIAGMLPQATWAATEARSYALSTAAMAAAMLTLAIAVRRNSWSSWLAWFAVAVLAIHLYLYIALGFIGAIPGLLWLAPQIRRRALGFGSAVIAACTPFAIMVLTQGSQLDWLTADTVSFTWLTLRQFWRGNEVAGWSGIAVAGVSVVALLVAARTPTRRFPTALVLGWLVGPSLALAAFTPIRALYLPRYVTFTVGALAITIGAAIAGLRKWWLQLAATLLVVALSAPAFLHSRELHSKDTMLTPYTQLQRLVRSGDGLYPAGVDVDRPFWAFPDQVSGMVDLAHANQPGWRDEALFDSPLPAPSVASSASTPSRVWIWGARGTTDDLLASTVEPFRDAGFSVGKPIKLDDGVRVVLVERG